MPRYNTREEVVQTFEPLAENYNLTYHAHRRDVRPFVDFTNLVSGENVLDLGTDSARVAVEAKRRVGPGICVGIDLCKPLLSRIGGAFHLQRIMMRIIITNTVVVFSSYTHLLGEHLFAMIIEFTNKRAGGKTRAASQIKKSFYLKSCLISNGVLLIKFATPTLHQLGRNLGDKGF